MTGDAYRTAVQSTEDLIREARLHNWGPNPADYDLPSRLVEALEQLSARIEPAYARAEAQRRWPSPNSGLYEGLTEGFVLGAQWAAAEAWEEGFDAGERDAVLHVTFDEPCITNPYRGSNHGA